MKIKEITGKAESATIVATLNEIRPLYTRALTMSHEDKQRLLLEGIMLNATVHFASQELVDAIRDTLTDYPLGSWPHDSSLIKEVRTEMLGKLSSSQIDKILPLDSFDIDMEVYKWFDFVIEHLFNTAIWPLKIAKQDVYALKKIQRALHNTFVENPNFQYGTGGQIPYYKRDYSEMIRSRKLSLEYLENDFNDWILYFEEEPEDAEGTTTDNAEERDNRPAVQL